MTSVVDGDRLFDVSMLHYNPIGVSGTTEGSALVKQRPAIATVMARAV